MRKNQSYVLNTLVAVLISTAVQAEVLIGWDGGTTTNTAIRANGVSGTLFTGNLYLVDNTAGSSDGTFGGSLGGANIAATAYEVRTVSLGNNNTLGIQIQNNTGTVLQLDSLSFDYLAWFSNSPKTVILNYAFGDLANSDHTTIQTISGLSDGGGKFSDYTDYDWSLTPLSDRVLADGEKATFHLIATAAIGENTSGAFDNVAISGTVGSPVIVTVTPGIEEHAVTTMSLGGSGLVYPWEADSLYSDGSVAHLLKDIGAGVLRWPGGTVVTFSHWDALTGNGWSDSWNPTYDPAANKPQEDFMDVDEYLELIDQTGAEIMLGINMSSGKEWDREAKGIAEAQALAQHCKDQGHTVNYFYLDNESYIGGNSYNQDPDGDGESWNPTNYAHSFNLYATALKTVYPAAKLIANWTPNVNTTDFENQIQDMFSVAGANIDYLDLHWYWAYQQGTWDLWKSQLPMKRTQHLAITTDTYAESIVDANALFATLGYPQIKLAVMEWNISDGPWQTDSNHTHFKTSLMQTEMQIQFLQGGLEIGIFFATHSPNVSTAEDKHIIKSADGSPNTTALWMWLFSKTIGKTVVQSTSPAVGIYIVTAKGTDEELVTYLLNKNDTGAMIEFNTPGYTISEVSEAWRLKDDGTGEGVLENPEVWDVSGNQRVALHADSLVMLGFNYPTADTDSDGMTDAWEISEFGSITNANSSSDADADEYPDYKEFAAGTDPHDTQAFLTFQHALSIPTDPFSDTLLIGWDTSSGAGDIGAAGVSGSLLAGSLYAVDGTAGSTDGTFGSTHAGATTALTAYAVRTVTPGSTDTLKFQIINNTGLDLHLNAIHFDYSRWFSNSPQDVTLSYTSGDLDALPNTTISSTTGISVAGKANDYSDFDWSLAGLGDIVLAPGEEANFALLASNSAGETTNGAFDNIAISGSGVTGSGPTVTISWLGQTGRKYQVMQSTNLTSGMWQPITAAMIGVPGKNSTSVNFGTPPVFFELQVSP